eukprot:9380569-Pyramimonas_sp.AAC.1
MSSMYGKSCANSARGSDDWALSRSAMRTGTAFCSKLVQKASANDYLVAYGPSRHRALLVG